ncbi:hypothetical protein [Tenacibaculum jejuense]|uniref:Uncharacterized protein n=1 Tax=Tenacibaculum jejuense TaxID=584609 RepID=A0A238U456_9FLAO|nr:hypothetical protein [Tenacibaculum jejuense]SNR13917.1 conserved protein of unknown function [Tenacibaculum jejuense]
MKQGKEDFKIFKKNTKNKNKNYIFQNNKETRSGFYVVLGVIVLGISMIVASGILI